MAEKNSDIRELAEAIRQSNTEMAQALLAQLPPKKVTINEFVNKNPYNPTGRERVMVVEVYQNGAKLEESTLYDAEFDALPKLRAGRFLDRRVTVSRDNSGPVPVIRITYPCKTTDQRMANKDYFRSLGELLHKLTTEEPIKD